MESLLEINNETTLDDLDIIINEVSIGKIFVQWGIATQIPIFTEIGRGWIIKNRVFATNQEYLCDLSNVSGKLNIGDLISIRKDHQKIKDVILKLLTDDKKEDSDYIKIFVNKVIAILAMVKEIDFKMMFLCFDHLETPPVTALGGVNDAIKFKETLNFLD